MKKLITLVICVLMGGSTFGQELVVNGNLEGEQEANWSSFWVQDPSKEGPTDEASGQGPSAVHSDGTGGWKYFADIVDNPFKKGEHCVKVHVMSEAEAIENGNARYSGGTFVQWNTQFFIYSKQAIPVGKWIRLKFKVRGEKSGSMQSQTHQEPGKHIGNNFCGSVDYESDKWTKVDKVVEVTSSHTTKSGTEYEFHSVCFNLSTVEGNEIYFDDISMVMSDEEPIIEKKEDNDNFFVNFLKFGTETNDSCKGIGKSNGKDAPFACTTFTLKDPFGEKQAPVVDIDGEKVIKVSTMGFTSEQVPDLDSLGNEQPDTINGGILMKTVYKWADGTLVGSGSNAGKSEPEKYAYQLFITTPHKFKADEKYRLVFWARADKEAELNTQAHYGPGQYIDYGSFGKAADLDPIPTEWHKYEMGVTEEALMNSKAKGGWSVCLDLYQLKEANNYYFRFEELSFTDSKIEVGERTLGSADIALPVNDGGDEPLPTTVDVADMLKIFGEEDFGFMNEDGNTLKLRSLTVPEEEGDDPEDTFAAVDSWTDGGFVNEEGYFIGEDDKGIEVGLTEESFNEGNIDFHVWNNPDAGISFADGKTVKTQLCISKGGWYYIYNVTLMSQEKYSETGISGVKSLKIGKNVLYNLAGQRVGSSYKGIVIKDGKKAVLK